MAQQHKIGTHATTVAASKGTLRVTYHSTVIVEISGDTVTLNSGGWRTSTTKTRINQAAHQFDLGFQVIQKDFQWFVQTAAGVVPFTDGMSFTKAPV